MSRTLGGAAFPGVGQTLVVPRVGMGPAQVIANYAPGMSLRDWFAGMAIPGLVERWGAGDAAGLARDAYAVADALLTHRHTSP